jgi:hypothetical protein
MAEFFLVLQLVLVLVLVPVRTITAIEKSSFPKKISTNSPRRIAAVSREPAAHRA